MAQWRQARTSRCLYAVSKCTRGPDDTPCRDEPVHGEPPGIPSCSICERVRSALFQGIERDRAMEIAVEALKPDMPGLPMGGHWDPRVAPPPVAARPQVPHDPNVRPKVKAHMRVGGGNQVFRQPADARQLPPPPPPSQVAGGVAGVGVASVPISPARGGKAPARGAVRPLAPPLPPPLGAMPPHAGQGGAVPVSCTRQWAPRARKRISWNCIRVSGSARVDCSRTIWSSPEGCSRRGFDNHEANICVWEHSSTG